jgi:hypothetical protein
MSPKTSRTPFARTKSKSKPHVQSERARTGAACRGGVIFGRRRAGVEAAAVVGKRGKVKSGRPDVRKADERERAGVRRLAAIERRRVDESKTGTGLGGRGNAADQQSFTDRHPKEPRRGRVDTDLGGEDASCRARRGESSPLGWRGTRRTRVWPGLSGSRCAFGFIDSGGQWLNISLMTLQMDSLTRRTLRVCRPTDHPLDDLPFPLSEPRRGLSDRPALEGGLDRRHRCWDRREWPVTLLPAERHPVDLDLA